MLLELPSPPPHYKSKSQRARVCTEPWAAVNLFCPNCPSPALTPTPPNTEVVDLRCPECDEAFQLKSQSHAIGRSIVDSGYEAMLRGIRKNGAPNIVAVHYDPTEWCVRNVLLIPGFGYTESAIVARPPLGPNARRAGWIGCNILLSAIPAEIKIHVVKDSTPVEPSAVRRTYRKLSSFKKVKPLTRGWRLDVWRAVEKLGKREFTLKEAYSAEEDLARLHPNNHRIQDKIRQQLQELRDMGLIEFLGNKGRYRLL